MSLRPRRARAAAGLPPATTIDDRLRSTFRLLRVAMAFMALAGIVVVGYDRYNIQPALHRSSNAQRALLLANGGMLDQETGLRGWLLTGDPTFLQPDDQGISETRQGDAQLRAALAGSDPQFMAEFEAAQQAWISEWAAVARSAGSQIPRATLDTFVLEGKALFDRYRATEAPLAAAVDQDRATALQRSGTVGYLAVGVELVAAAGALALSRRQRRRLGAALAGPAAELVTVIGRIGQGDLDTRASRGEVRELNDIARGLNRMGARIGDAQRSLADAEWRARQIAELSPDGVGVKDAAGRVVYANPALAQMVGYPDPAGMLGMAASSLLADETTRVAEDRRATVLGGATVRGSHEKIRRLDGALIDVDINSARCDLGDGPGVLSVIRDATDQRRTEAALHAAVVQEQEVAVRLRAVDQARTELVATVSHELRTPLTSINGYVEMLVDGDAGEVNPEQREMLEAVERNGKRLLNLIEDLLAQSRLDSGDFRLVRVPLLVSELIGRCEEAVAPLVARRGHELLVEAGTGGAPVEGDVDALERVIL
ncbi:MAG: histidine kinase dimerization/phospho-acceptor domain-containing protein, partial [Acidimicrobiales bacterium]